MAIGGRSDGRIVGSDGFVGRSDGTGRGTGTTAGTGRGLALSRSPTGRFGIGEQLGGHTAATIIGGLLREGSGRRNGYCRWFDG